MMSKSLAIFFSLSLILFAKVGGSCWTIGFGGSSSMTGDSTVGVSGIIKEGIYLSHFPNEDRVLAGGIDVEEDALGIADVAAVEQWGIQGIEDGILNSAFSARPAHPHI